jgi:aldehyde dehydrogenase (NAD+)
MSVSSAAPVISERVRALEELPIETRLFINWEFVPSKAGKTFEVASPTTEKFVDQLHEADATDVDDAVAAAKAAFPAWSELSSVEPVG